MKTRALSVLRPPTGFLKDLEVFNQIGPDQLQVLTQVALDMFSSERVPFDDLDSIKSIAGTSISGETLQKVLTTTSYARYALGRFGDSLEDFVADLELETKYSPAAREAFTKIMHALDQKGPLDVDYEIHYDNVLPIYSSISTRCILLSRFSQDDTSSRSGGAIDNDELKFLKPVAVISLDINEPNEYKQVAFILSEKKIDGLIGALLNAKSRLETLSKLTKKIASEIGA